MVHDPRVSRAGAPGASGHLVPRAGGALDAVRFPVLMLSGEQDSVTPPPHHADLVARQFPRQDLLDYRTVAGAGHFSFLSVFPTQMRQPHFAPAQDPPGFDRAAFRRILLKKSCIS